jgi:hypothetical protein
MQDFLNNFFLYYIVFFLPLKDIFYLFMLTLKLLELTSARSEFQLANGFPLATHALILAAVLLS